VDYIVEVNLGLRQILHPLHTAPPLILIFIPVLFNTVLHWLVQHLFQMVNYCLKDLGVVLRVADKLKEWLDGSQKLICVWPYQEYQDVADALIGSLVLTTASIHLR
jgi:hypothetical protein